LGVASGFRENLLQDFRRENHDPFVTMEALVPRRP
jgi:hypothetical protein